MKKWEDGQPIQNEKYHKQNKKDNGERDDVILRVGMSTRKMMK